MPMVFDPMLLVFLYGAARTVPYRLDPRRTLKTGLEARTKASFSNQTGGLPMHREESALELGQSTAVSSCVADVGLEIRVYHIKTSTYNSVFGII